METLRLNAVFILSLIICQVAVAQPDSKTMAAFSESYKHEQSQNYTSAINSLKTIYKAEDYSINVRLGWLCLLGKQYTESVSYYERAIKLKPYAIEARFGMIKSLNALESWDKVKENYEAIIRIDPQNTTSLYWLGVLLYNRKDYEGAAKNFEKIVNLYPMDYGSVIMLAWTRLYQGRKTEAKVLFNHALLLSPDDASATSGLNMLR
ncbi:MAG: tetratricopeptide repeat protein [Bacteroidales bacterium]